MEKKDENCNDILNQIMELENLIDNSHKNNNEKEINNDPPIPFFMNIPDIPFELHYINDENKEKEINNNENEFLPSTPSPPIMINLNNMDIEKFLMYNELKKIRESNEEIRELLYMMVKQSTRRKILYRKNRNNRFHPHINIYKNFNKIEKYFNKKNK
jgi:hypothetical protein